MSENNYISIKGARVNNLKNIDVDIPRNKIVVITGLSGSAKIIQTPDKFANFADYHKKGVFYVRKQLYFDQRCTSQQP